MTRRARIAACALGLVAGTAVGAGFVISGLIPASQARLGAGVTVRAQATGELAVEPQKAFLSAANLHPGSPGAGARGVVSVTNQTAVPLVARLRVLPSATNLDDLLRVRVNAGGTPIIEGELAQLRDWTARPFRLEPGRSTPVSVRAWLPASARDAYAARSAELMLAFRTRPVGGR